MMEDKYSPFSSGGLPPEKKEVSLTELLDTDISVPVDDKIYVPMTFEEDIDWNNTILIED